MYKVASQHQLSWITTRYITFFMFYSSHIIKSKNKEWRNERNIVLPWSYISFINVNGCFGLVIWHAAINAFLFICLAAALKQHVARYKQKCTTNICWLQRKHSNVSDVPIEWSASWLMSLRSSLKSEVHSLSSVGFYAVKEWLMAGKLSSFCPS